MPRSPRSFARDTKINVHSKSKVGVNVFFKMAYRDRQKNRRSDIQMGRQINKIDELKYEMDG